jgi:hypothetical protein
MKLLLDTSVLVLLVVGRTDPRWISWHKATKSRLYRVQDFARLEEILKSSDGVLITPHIATETSNLLEWGESAVRREVFKTLKHLSVRCVHNRLHGRSCCIRLGRRAR